MEYILYTLPKYGIYATKIWNIYTTKIWNIYYIHYQNMEYILPKYGIDTLPKYGIETLPKYGIYTLPKYGICIYIYIYQNMEYIRGLTFKGSTIDLHTKYTENYICSSNISSNSSEWRLCGIMSFLVLFSPPKPPFGVKFALTSKRGVVVKSWKYWK